MKYFYSIVLDGYSYYLVTEKRFANMIEFMESHISDVFDDILEYDRDIDLWDYLEEVSYYPDGDYVAVDENNEELQDLIDVNKSFEDLKARRRGEGELTENAKKAYKAMIKLSTKELDSVNKLLNNTK